jgi:hypothetical protein
MIEFIFGVFMITGALAWAFIIYIILNIWLTK